MFQICQFKGKTLTLEAAAQAIAEKENTKVIFINALGDKILQLV